MHPSQAQLPALVIPAKAGIHIPENQVKNTILHLSPYSVSNTNQSNFVLALRFLILASGIWIPDELARARSRE